MAYAAFKGAGALLGLPRPFAQLTFSRAFLARDGRLLRLTTAGDGRYRLWTKLEDIAPAVVNSTLTKEDHRFREHVGFDLRALARAGRDFVFGQGRSGASTISMQLARLIWRLETRTLSGKARQIAYALSLEARWSKDEILEAYLNLAPYGGNVEGVGAAAWIYFGKSANALTKPEALRLALLPQSPGRVAELVNLHENAGRQASARAAGERLAAKLSPDSAASRLVAAAFSLTATPRTALASHAPHFVERLRSRLQAPEAYRSGSTFTSLDLGAQELVERQLARHLEGLKKIGIANGAVLLVHRPTGEVRAYAGSGNFLDASIDGQVDGIRAQRSPGSALKPVLYGLAIDRGLIHPMSMMLDVPAGFGAYDPENFDRSFLGPVDATTALVTSRNVPAIDLLGRLTATSFHRALTEAGVALKFSAEHYGLTLAVGGAEISMEELAVLYGALGGDGRTRALSFGPGELQATAPRRALISADAAFLVRKMLAENPRPEDRRGVVVQNLPVAWKTGTSFGFRDAWAAGNVGDWVLVVWLGDFRGRPNPALVGRDAAGPLFFKIADALAMERPGETRASFAAPGAAAPELRAKKVRVCALSGGLPSLACLLKKETWFLPGVSPAQTCPVHRFAAVRAASGKRACPSPQGGFLPGSAIEQRIFEFWPSDALRAFAHLGVPRRGAPPFESRCAPALYGSAVAGMGARSDLAALKILSPRRGLVYPVPVGEGRSADPIMLAARAGADAGKIFWFLDETLLGETAPGETLAWAPRPGRFVVRAVDQQGRSDARDVIVVAAR